MKIASRHATALLVGVCVKKIDVEQKWQTIVGACAVVEDLAGSFGAEVQNCLPEIIPSIKPMLADAKKEVAAAAMSSLERCIGLVDNRDIQPFLPALISAMKDTAETTECIHKLAGTTFVATVSRGPLAVIVPLLVWGFRDPKTATRRMCAKIGKRKYCTVNSEPLTRSRTRSVEHANELCVRCA